MKRNRLTHTRPKDTQILQISKARQENQANVSVYHEKMLDGKWQVFEFHQEQNETDFRM